MVDEQQGSDPDGFDDVEFIGRASVDKAAIEDDDEPGVLPPPPAVAPPPPPPPPPSS